MENGARIIPASGYVPFNRYRIGARGLDNPNSSSIWREERADSDIRVPMKGTIYNEFPPFLAQPPKTTSKPIAIVHIGNLLKLNLIKTFLLKSHNGF